MSAAHDILIRLMADSSGLITGMGKATSAMSGFESRVSKVTSLVGGLSAGLGAIGLTSFVTQSINAADSLHDLAQKTGSSVEELSALRLIADQNGTSLEGVAKGFKALAKNQLEAAGGSSEMSKLLSSFGVSGNNALTALIQISDQFAKMPDGMEKSALAQKLFGKAGTDMIPILNLGSEELKKQIEWAQKHAAITTEDANRADALGDKIAEMKAKAAATVTAGAAGPLDAMIAGLDAILSWANEHPELASWLAMGAFGVAAAGVAAGGAVMAISAISTAVGLLIPVLTGLGAFLVANPIVAALLGVAAVGVAIYKNWDAITGAFKKGVEAVRATVKDWVKVGEDIINGLWHGIQATMRKPLDAIGDLAKKLPAWAKDLLGIKSPSKVFEQIGENIGDGLVKGIDGSTADAKTAATELIEAVIVEPVGRQRTAGGKFKSAADAAVQGTGIKGGLAEYADAIQSTEDAIKDMTVRSFKGMEDALTKFVMTGKLDFKNLTNSIIADMVRMQIQQSITKPLATAGSAFLASMFAPSAQGNVFSGAGISAFSGQVVNRPTVFPFAKGIGLMGEAGAEAIMPLTRINGRLGVDAAAAAPVVNIHVNNRMAQQAQVSVTQHQGPKGTMLEISIDQVEAAIARNVARGRGSLASVLGGQYGLNRAAGAV